MTFRGFGILRPVRLGTSVRKLAGALGAAAVVLAIRCLSSQPTSPIVPHSAVDTTDGATGHRRWGTAFASVLGIIVLAGVLLYGIGRSYATYEDATAVPRMPNRSPGAARLYFAQPCVKARLESTITLEGGGAEFDYLIRLLDVGQPGPTESGGVRSPCEYGAVPTLQSVPFLLVLVGDARPTLRRYYPGGPTREANGCAVQLYGVPDVQCSAERIEEDGNPRNTGRTSAELVRGRLVPNSSGYAFASVHVSTEVGFLGSTKARTIYELPAIGTTYLPSGDRNYPLEFGVQMDWRVPDVLDVLVDAGTLSAVDRVETVSPAPLLAGRLVWFETDASTVEPAGSWVDVVVESSANRALFVVAVLGGVLASMLAAMLLWSLKSLLKSLVSAVSYASD